MDYALLPVTPTFDFDDGLFTLPAGHSFADADTLSATWDMIQEELNSQVFKIGATTHQTNGVLFAIGEGVLTISATTRPYSAKGDSGALVFVTANNKLVPVGLHYAGTDGERGKAISLESIFRHFCERNSLKQIRVEFLSPKLNKDLHFYAPSPMVPAAYARRNDDSIRCGLSDGTTYAHGCRVRYSVKKIAQSS